MKKNTGMHPDLGGFLCQDMIYRLKEGCLTVEETEKGYFYHVR